MPTTTTGLAPRPDVSPDGGTVDASRGFAWVRVEGVLTVEKVRRLHTRILELQADGPPINALWDLRAASLVQLDTARLREIVAFLEPSLALRIGAQIALLVGREVDFGIARVFEALCDLNFPLTPCVVRCEGEALRWVQAH